VQAIQGEKCNLTRFSKISGLKSFPESFRGPLKRCDGPNRARGPIVGPHWSRFLKLQLNIFGVR